MSYIFTYTMQKVARVSEWLLYVTYEVPGKSPQWMKRYSWEVTIFSA